MGRMYSTQDSRSVVITGQQFGRRGLYRDADEEGKHVLDSCSLLLPRAKVEVEVLVVRAESISQ